MFAVCKELVLSFRYTAEMTLPHLTNRQVELLQAFASSGRLQFKLWRNNNVTAVMSEVPMFIQKRKHNYQTVERKAVDSTGRDVLVQFRKNDSTPAHLDLGAAASLINTRADSASSSANSNASLFEPGRNCAEILIKFEIKISTASDGQSQYFFKCLVGDVEIFRTTPYFTTRARNHREIKRKREQAASTMCQMAEDTDSLLDSGTPTTPLDDMAPPAKKVFPSSNRRRQLRETSAPAAAVVVVEDTQRDRVQLIQEVSRNLRNAPTNVIARINKQISSLPQLMEASRYGTRTGLTPLHKACIDGQTNLAQELIRSRRFFVNSQDNAGDTPLHLACFHGHTDTAVMLLNCDADFLILNKEKKLPIDKAVDGAQHPTVVQLLEWMNNKYIAHDSPAQADLARFLTQIKDLIDRTSPASGDTPLTEGHSTDDDEQESENELTTRDSPSDSDEER